MLRIAGNWVTECLGVQADLMSSARMQLGAHQGRSIFAGHDVEARLGRTIFDRQDYFVNAS